MSNYVIETEGLTRTFGKHCAVHDLNLRVPKGSIFGFLGRNGAGKSTTIRMVLGLVKPTRGVARVLGRDSRALQPEDRARIGYLPEGHHVYGWMTVEECGRFQASFYPRWNPDIFQTLCRRRSRRSEIRTSQSGCRRQSRASKAFPPMAYPNNWAESLNQELSTLIPVFGFSRPAQRCATGGSFWPPTRSNRFDDWPPPRPRCRH